MNEVKSEVKTEAVVVQEVQVTALEQITRGEIDIAIATAHRFPRSVAQFKQDATDMVTLDPETAESCFYHLEREGKVIEGPSVRFAEIIGSCWGNMRYGARIVSEEKDYVVAQGVAHDLEKNVSSTVEIRRRITKRDGKRFSSDMIIVTANAACAIALRNAIYKVIPKGLTNDIYEKAVATAVGDIESLAKKRQKAVEYFSKLGIKEEQLCAYLEKKGIEDIGLEDIRKLLGLVTALKEGDTTLEEVFPKPQTESKSGNAGLSELINNQNKTDKTIPEEKEENAVSDANNAPKSDENKKQVSEVMPEEKMPKQPQIKFE